MGSFHVKNNGRPPVVWKSWKPLSMNQGPLCQNATNLLHFSSFGRIDACKVSYIRINNRVTYWDSTLTKFVRMTEAFSRISERRPEIWQLPQYLVLTRPNILWSVSVVCCYLHNMLSFSKQRDCWSNLQLFKLGDHMKKLSEGRFLVLC